MLADHSKVPPFVLPAYPAHPTKIARTRTLSPASKHALPLAFKAFTRWIWQLSFSTVLLAFPRQLAFLSGILPAGSCFGLWAPYAAVLLQATHTTPSYHPPYLTRHPGLLKSDTLCIQHSE